MINSKMLTFVSPLWLTAGLLACCGAVLFLSLRTVHRRKELTKFAAPHLLPQLTANVSQARRRLKNILFVLGLACLFIALAQPQWGSRWIEVRSKGVDILIGFDVSKSMLAPDIKPSRLERAKLAVRDFTARLDGDRIGLLPFAGTSFLMCPLTTDYDAFNASLAALNTDAIPKGGTDIGQTIEDAVRVLAGELNHKILVLITDGEDLSQNALRAAAVAKQEKMLIYTVGVGTSQGELVPLPGGGAGNFVKDERGGFVTSRLDEKILAAVAETTGGIYVPLGSMGQGLDTVYERKLALIPKEEQAQRKKKVLLERFQWPLGAAALLLSLDFLLIGRRRKLRLPFIFTAGRRKKEQVAATAAVLLLLYMFCPVSARADQGSDLFQAGKYEQAAQFYQNALTNDSDNPTLHFNLGSSLHQQKKYDAAAAEFTKALKSSDINLQAKSYFNRGISQYRAGEEAEKKKADRAEAIQHLNQAEKSFAAAIKLAQEQQKKDKAARNQQKAKEKREQLEKQQKEQSQQSEKDDEKKEPKEQKKQEGKEENKQNSGSEAKQKQQGGKEEKNNADRAEKQDTSAAQKQNDQEKQQQKAASVPDKEQQKKESTTENPQKQAGAGDQNGKQPQPGGKDKEEVKIMGKMTEEEAGNLLDSLKAEQGELNFIPQEAADGNEVDRDW
ncbi:VWA domain-containing protein [Desulfobulbus sp. F5]|nr:VWA domain-containing protein [Desulfobulbus sp. F5]